MGDLLKGKVCLVTGAARGIGHQIVHAYAKEGAVVYANVRQMRKDQQWPDNVYPIVFDVTDTGSIRLALTKIRKEQGRLDVLVNNAAVEYNELIGMISTEHMQEMFAVNVYGVIHMLQYASRIMGRQESGGSIINLASIVGVKGNPGQLVYSATKGAVIAATKSAAKELAAKQIRVNAVAPGLTNTEMMQQVSEEKLRNRIDRIGLGRIAEPQDIANACIFLSSDLSSYISGQILGVDGCSVL